MRSPRHYTVHPGLNSIRATADRRDALKSAKTKSRSHGAPMKDRGHKKHRAYENSQPQENERRQHTRHAAKALPDIAVIQRGQAVRLIDVSTRGVLLETDDRLCPGRNVSLRFVTNDSEVTLNGYVV